MKPVYLEMNYFGPHEHSIIDFRKLEESPIFLIGGDTGAGKSTIFDAMTFALFSTTTGNREAKEMRSQFAPDNKPTKVTFYFEQNGKIYKVERTPSQYLAKVRGTGLVERKPTASLAVVDDVDGVEIESLATLPRDVGSDIDEILKLSAEQFKKIILLPQNDFSEFLKSETSEKEEILKKIFGTQIFTDFVAKLKVRFDKAKQTNSEYESALNSQYTSPIWSDDEKDSLIKANDDQKITVLEQHLENRQHNSEAAHSKETQANFSWDKANQEYQSAMTIQKQFDDLAANEHKYQTQILDKSDEIDAKNIHIAELDWAQPLKDIVRDLDKANNSQKDILQNQQVVTDKLTEAQQKYDSAKEKINQLTSKTDDFKNQQQQSKDLSILIPKVQRVEKIKTDLNQLKPQLDSLKQTIQSETEAINKLQKDIDEKSQKVVSLDELQTKKDNLILERDSTIDALSPLENSQNTLKKQVDKTKIDLDKLNSDFKQKSELLNNLQIDYEAQKSNRQKLMIAQLQQELVTGEPCPVCGSTAHPYADHTVEADETKLRKAMGDVEKSQKDFNAAENTVQILQNNIDKATQTLKQEQSDLNKAQLDLTNKYLELVEKSTVKLPQDYNQKQIKQAFQKATDDLNKKITSAQAINQEIKQLEQNKTDNQAQLTQTQLDLGKVDTKLKTWEADLQNSLKEIPDQTVSSNDLIDQGNFLDKAINKYQTELKSAQDSLHDSELKFNNTQTQLNDIQKQLTKNINAIEELDSQLQSSLKSDDARTNDLEILEKWIQEINQDKLSILKNEIASYNKEKEMLSDTIKDFKTKLTGKKQPDLDSLKQKLDELNDQKTTAIKLANSADNAYKEAQKADQAVKDILKKQGDFAKEYHAITGLYDVINGHGSDDTKLKLETFVVQNYLQQVLRYANDHFLGLLTGGRYSFILSDTAADNRRDHGLDINVMDSDTGFVRSTKTLSGGETFIAALSIALSLSEVVQSSSNGVKIDALFIDEGFGSLDDETLGKAMEALERIGQNRMVGVISHVESMKDTIGQQILIKKLGNGHSSVELVNK